ncbi:MAG: HAD-IIA family hydrolase [Fimbriimonadaceae bacterium]
MPIRLAILDLDGTLFRGAAPIPYAVEAVSAMRGAGVGICYLTNNSSQTVSEYVAKLSGMGFEAHPEEILSSATGAAGVCRERGWDSVFVVGEPGLVRTFQEAGIEVRNAVDGAVSATDDPDAPTVVIGICRSFSYALLAAAMTPVRRGANFLATNRDTTYPVEGGRLVPGAGSLVAALAACTDREPEVVGKPEPTLVRMALARSGVRAEDALMIGDRVDTDIEAGLRAGVPTHLVLTGVSDKAPPGVASSPDLRGVLPRLIG